MRVLALDPGLASFGACAVELPRCAVVGADVFRSAPSPRKRQIGASDDRYRRARELAGWLEALADRWRPSVVAVEAMSFPRSSVAIASMALAWGCLAAVAHRRGLPVVQASPQDWKRHVSGRKGTADADLYPTLYERGGAEVEADLVARGLPRSQHVHALDALGVALWSETTEVVRAGMAAAREAA
jgi:Holliday junction resolvasome RuvABC endonuclease subunit